jgi:hypothetical protein
VAYKNDTWNRKSSLGDLGVVACGELETERGGTELSSLFCIKR